LLNREKMVISEARRTYTYLGLFGYRVDAVVVNRVLPPDVTDPYFGKWKDIQAEHLATVHESFEPVPILLSRLFDREMVGIPLLEDMAEEVYGELDAVSILYHDDPIRVRKRDDGYVLRMRLPFVSRDDMDIHRRGEELVVRVGSYKRNLILPQSLKRMVVPVVPDLPGRHRRPTAQARGHRTPAEGGHGDAARVPRGDRCAGGGDAPHRGGAARPHAAREDRHRMSEAAPQAVGIDVGGTKIVALRVSGEGKELARSVRPTPAEDMDATLETRVAALGDVAAPDVVALGLGAVGPVEEGTGVLRFAPNLAWRDAPIAEVVGRAAGTRVIVENDCTAGADGAYRVGAARGVAHVLYIGVGTGIGGGLILAGSIYRGAHGFAAEVGHIVVEPDGPVCGCGNRGC